MAEISIVTEVSGRVCAVPAVAGAHVHEGDDVVTVESMKMEIPASSPARGIVKMVLVKLDDLVAEGQVVAVIETSA